MTSRFLNGQVIDATDFIQASAGVGDAGKAVVADDTLGKVDNSFLYNRPGGTGADGALTITSGTTTLNVGSVAKYTKNYTSVSITSTAKLLFTTPHANGTIVEIYCQGAFIVTSSTVPAIDCSSMGASAGNKGRSNIGLTATNGGNASGGSGGAVGTATVLTSLSWVKNPIVYAGSGGGNGSAGNGSSQDGAGGAGGSTLDTAGTGGSNSGGNTPGVGTAGTGGIGGGGLYIEVGGYYNVTSTITVAGAVGGNAVGGAAGGGGGGSGGSIVVRYCGLTANSGTYTVSGGAGGSRTGFAGVGGAGANGYSSVGYINN